MFRPHKLFQKGAHRLAMLTAYDARTASLAHQAGCDVILVGDSVATVLLGYRSTRDISLEEMLFVAKAARRGAPKDLIVGDMPYVSLKKTGKTLVADARRFIEEASMDAVKLEWNPRCLSQVKTLVAHGIRAMGHVGLTPQSVRPKAPFRVQASLAKDAMTLLDNAKKLQDAGAFSLVVECVPSPVARQLTKSLKIPVIGIGAGPDCDGQVLVYHDVVGAFEAFQPRFVKRYARVAQDERKALSSYVADVKRGLFPAREHTYAMTMEERMKFQSLLFKEKA